MSDPDSTTTPTTLPPAKRPRPVISCLECRRKKLKCSRTYPCQQCLKVGRPGRCEYQAGQEPEPNLNYTGSLAPSPKRQRVLPPASNHDATTPPSSNQPDLNHQASVSTKPGVVEDLQERVARLEQALLAHDRQPNGGTPARGGLSGHPRTAVVVDEEGHLVPCFQMSSQVGRATLSRFPRVLQG
jgi:hypothetical protein